MTDDDKSKESFSSFIFSSFPRAPNFAFFYSIPRPSVGVLEVIFKSFRHGVNTLDGFGRCRRRCIPNYPPQKNKIMPSSEIFPPSK